MTLMEAAQLLGNFGEFFGAIAIVVTLIYLARQIQENTNSNLVMTRSHFVEQGGKILDSWTNDPELAALMGKGAWYPDELDDADWDRYTLQLQKIFWLQSSQYYQHRIGAMDDDTFHEVDVQIRRFARQPGVWKFWLEAGKSFSPTFSCYVAGLIEQARERAVSHADV